MHNLPPQGKFNSKKKKIAKTLINSSKTDSFSCKKKILFNDIFFMYIHIYIYIIMFVSSHSQATAVK